MSLNIDNALVSKLTDLQPLSLKDYASTKGLSEEQVLQLIEDGLLLARFNGKTIVVSKNHESFANSEESKLNTQMPIVLSEDSGLNRAERESEWINSFNKIFSLANGFDRKLDDVMNQVVRIQMENESSISKKMNDLKKQVTEKEDEIRKLHQKLEDLETLNRSLNWKVEDLQKSSTKIERSLY